jgi:hypothetical protein
VADVLLFQAQGILHEMEEERMFFMGEMWQLPYKATRTGDVKLTYPPQLSQKTTSSNDLRPSRFGV